MEVLEFHPIKNKTVNIYLIRREDRDLLSLHHSNLEKIIEAEKFKFAIVDFNDPDVKKYYLLILTIPMLKNIIKLLYQSL